LSASVHHSDLVGTAPALIQRPYGAYPEALVRPQAASDTEHESLGWGGWWETHPPTRFPRSAENPRTERDYHDGQNMTKSYSSMGPDRRR